MLKTADVGKLFLHNELIFQATKVKWLLTFFLKKVFCEYVHLFARLFHLFNFRVT